MRRSSRGPIRQQHPNKDKAPKPFFSVGQHDLTRLGEAPFFQTQSNTGVKDEEKNTVQKKGKEEEEKTLQKLDDDTI